MTRETENELTPDERAAFEALPKTREPSGLLEERTVRALGDRGLLEVAPRRWMHRRIPAFAAGIAAALALFVGGIAVGQWLGSRAVADSMAAAQHQTALEMAVAVQHAGSAYVSALAALSQLADSSANGALAQGREAALTALYAAAHELVQLAPDDPIAITIRDRLDHLRREQQATDDQGTIRHVVWF
jgi:hypothetical protein